jgi:hypothetical protein
VPNDLRILLSVESDFRFALGHCAVRAGAELRRGSGASLTIEYLQ